MANRVVYWASRYAILIVAAIVALIPIVWLVSLSFKPQLEWYARPPIWISARPTLENWSVVFFGTYVVELGVTTPSAVKPIINSVIAASGATVLSLITGYMAAYCISRLKIARYILNFTLFTRVFPPIAIMIPLVIFFSTIGMLDTLIGLIFVYAAFGVVFVIWFMKSMIDEVPYEVEEAAMLEGVSRWGIIFRITLPLVRGGLAAAGLLLFILSWGEFLGALVLTSTDAFTIPVQLIKFQSATGAQLGPMAATSTFAIMPVLVISYYIQRHLVRGLTFGTVRSR